jgi:GNAT superfamily N-acetyltransferase
VPTLVHLEVLGPYQRRGIGSALIHAGEDTARRLGHPRLAIGVGLDNHDARRLYERLGYTDWGRGHTVASWREHRPGGAPVTVTETIDMLVKRL